MAFSISPSEAWSCAKFWFALRSGYASASAKSWRKAEVSAFSAWARVSGVCAVMAAPRARTTASSVPRSWAA